MRLDDYIVVTNSDDLTCSGLVTSVINDDILVHAHDPGPQLKSFMPNWTRGKFYKSQRKAPRGHSPAIIATTLSDVGGHHAGCAWACPSPSHGSAEINRRHYALRVPVGSPVPCTPSHSAILAELPIATISTRCLRHLHPTSSVDN